MHHIKQATRVQRSNITKTGFVCDNVRFFECKGGKFQSHQILTGQAIKAQWSSNVLYVDYRPVAKVFTHRVLGSKKPMFSAAVELPTGRTTTRKYKTKASVRKATEALLGLR